MGRPPVSPMDSEVIEPLSPDDPVCGGTLGEPCLQTLADLFHGSSQVSIPPPAAFDWTCG